MAVEVDPNERREATPDEDEDDRLSDTSSSLIETRSEEYPLYFIERDNRLFPSHGYPRYPFPVDTYEQERMNDQHDLLRVHLGGNIVAPVRQLLSQRPSQRQLIVLDLCTGTGKWPVEMAQEFPHVKFNALDIVPICTQYPPKNVNFVLWDASTRTWFPNASLDFVHARHCELLPADKYIAMLTEASRVLRPGGLIFLGEWFHLPVDAAGVSPPGVVAFYQALNSSLYFDYWIPTIPPFLVQIISQLGGFDDIQTRDYCIPIGDWAPNAARDLGVEFRNTLKTWVESATVVIAKAGHDEAAINKLVYDFLSDIFNIPGLHIAYRTVTARRTTPRT
ncbi:S-adenosyl-L-methionine-dependent methyltransferase [Thelephora terrestris]|uniref:S-adenosyl-L-methionine-dependent methyltransferase n=1 Tax=Thelephora terrestris TaxID=56493 RepID=A0A9P6HER6_9AGAM|nr:S-adenosyl-L-methionine-dependent methyltransferase [Thelephora terrestris]